MKKMFFWVLLLWGWQAVAQECPDWVKQRPVTRLYYTGIGMVSKSEKNYMEEAKTRALRDLASEIKVTVSASSLLKTLEQNGVAASDYEESIRTEVSEAIEKYELVDSWQDEKEYWVYYQLNHFDYEEYMERRREQALRSGFDFWQKGESALQDGELLNAVDFFLKGLEAVRVVANEELSCSYDGRTMDVGRELYVSLQRACNGIKLEVMPAIVEGVAFQGVDAPVRIKATREGVALKNLQLVYRFNNGAGKLSEPLPTNADGESELYIRNITSNLTDQEVRIEIDRSVFARFRKGIYRQVIADLQGNLPGAALYLRVGQEQLTAFLLPAADTDVQVRQSVRRLLTNHFLVSESAEGADVIVRLNTDFRKGEVVAGEMRDMVSYYITARLEFADIQTGKTLNSYAVEELRVLQPSTVSAATAKSAAIRELTRRMQTGLKKNLAGFKLAKEKETTNEE